MIGFWSEGGDFEWVRSHAQVQVNRYSRTELMAQLIANVMDRTRLKSARSEKQKRCII